MHQIMYQIAAAALATRPIFQSCRDKAPDPSGCVGKMATAQGRQCSVTGASLVALRH